MKTALVCLVAIVALLSQAGESIPLRHRPADLPDAPFQWQNCGDASYKLEVTDMTLLPYPPVPGKNVTATIKGRLEEQVTGGDWQTKIYYGPLPGPSSSGKICDALTDCKCPCGPGDLTVVQHIAIPTVAPKGNYKGTFTATDQAIKPFACVSFSFTI